MISKPTKETTGLTTRKLLKKTQKNNDQEEPPNKSHSNVKSKWAARNNV